MKRKSSFGLFFRSHSLIHWDITTKSSKVTTIVTTTQGAKETQEFKAKKNLLVSTLSDKE